MNKKEFDRMFIQNEMPSIIANFESDGIKDFPARCQCYNDFADLMFKEGRITEKQVRRFCIPTHLTK